MANGVATGNWQLATGDGENLTARFERFGWTCGLGRAAAVRRSPLPLAVVVASCQLPVASCQIFGENHELQ